MDGPAEVPGLTLAVAPTKNPARMEWLVEKAVEVGVDSQLPHFEGTVIIAGGIVKLIK